MNELALFAGAGGGILGAKLLGWRTVCAVEVNTFCARRLMQRQNEGHLPPFPVWDDVCTFDGQPWNGAVDVVSGGFPCQDISICGPGTGIDGERSGLWREMARIIGEVKPRFVLVENSPMLVRRGLTRVIGDLARMGFAPKWGCLGGDHVGNVANGKRLWIVATQANGTVLESVDIFKSFVVGSEESFRRQHSRAIRKAVQQNDYTRIKRTSDDVAEGMERLKAIGNGQNPQVVKVAWETLKQAT